MPPSDPAGSGYYSMVPDKTGTYSVQANFPEQWRNRTATTTWGFTPAGGGCYPDLAYFLMEECDSPIVTFTVTDQQLQWIPEVSLPAEYWTRPISAYNREWYKIAGNWITGNRDLQYITAPDSPHVLWTEPYFYGGIAGGAFEANDYYEGTAYEGKFRGATIMQGVLFYFENLGSTSTIGKVVARDLRTGNLLYELNNTSISRSWIYSYESRNQHGLHPYLWLSGNRIIDPFSGTELFNYINVPGGTTAVGPNGEILIYVFGGPEAGGMFDPAVNRTWLACWNSTAMLTMTGIRATELATYRATGKLIGTNYDQWRPIGKTHNGSDPEAYSWNVTLPPGFQTGYNTYALSDRIIGGTGFPMFRFEAQHGNFRVWCISIEKGSEGEVLWDIRPEPPAANVTLMWSGMSVDDGVLVLRAKEPRQYIAYDIDTGKQLWVSEPQPEWMMFSTGCTIYNGKLYAGGYGGEVFAYDVKNGTLLWKAEADAEGLESAYGRAPLGIQVVDSKVYAISQEHSMTHPYYRTWKTYCFDAETGDRLWTLTGGWSFLAFADGNMVGLNYFDGQIYCVGKGPSATTVTASPKVSMQGSSVLVEGTVIDISAGTKSDRIAPRFPNGVPAIADENMTAWMEYVYMQMPKPADATGVEVVLSVLDPNNNYYEVGRTTSDASGFYSCAFSPAVPGN
jgi:outer membrane protein assembly factor BamB